MKELTRESGLFRLTTAPGVLLARNVVIATGDQNRQVRPPESADLPVELRQVDSSAYRNAAQLEHGAVLVVGSGQSGGQIAEDLALAGRVVFLATSRNGRWVRRYRGGNILNWLTLSGFLDVPRKELVLPSGKVPARACRCDAHDQPAIAERTRRRVARPLPRRGKRQSRFRR
ncbi:NAD(P)-binding domain-containing protein [Rhizobium gallicum]|uniref:NAD(P)-binding domain-containing protein n=1 Tax=Rhizobium gallicum TaxID=56730 RepID=UPI0030B88699